MAWRKLIQILALQDEKYLQILEYLQKQQNYIVKNQTAELENVNKLLTDLYNETYRLEKDRLRLVSAIAVKLNMSAEELTLDNIRRLLSPDLIADYNAVTVKLKKTVREVKKYVENNASLLSLSLQYVDFSLNLLMGSNRTSYGDKGQEYASGRQNSFFSCEI
ncbi:MAG: flagellar protein FlgN [bacterium]